MANARRRMTEADVVAAIEQQVYDAIKAQTVSPLPLMEPYEGNPDQSSDEFMKGKIDRAKNEAYGMVATEEDYLYWTTQMLNSVDGGWSPYWEDRLRGKDATGEDAAKYGEFAQYISAESIKKAGARTAKAVTNFAMAVKAKLATQGTGDRSGGRSLSFQEQADLKAQLRKELQWAGAGGDAGPPDETDYGTYEPNTPNSWSDEELSSRIRDGLAISPHPNDDFSYWYNKLRNESVGADWDYWLHDKMDVPR